MVSKKERYGYKTYTLTLDPQDAEERKIIEWLEENKTRKLSYCKLIKEAIKEKIEKGKGDVG